jgi:hypothetical protein
MQIICGVVQYLGYSMVLMLYIILHVKYENGEEIWLETKNERQPKMQQLLTKMLVGSVSNRGTNCKRHILQKELQITS